MKFALAALVIAVGASSASAQQFAANHEFMTCAQSQTEVGLDVVRTECGTISRPNFSSLAISSLSDLETAKSQRESFNLQVADYGTCITQFINSYRRPGAPADSKAPDQAACAHAWAEDQATQTVREFGRACIAFSDKSMIDSAIEPWSGACYPSAGSGRG
jgi:hypothetical protein